MHPTGPPLNASGVEADLSNFGVHPKSPPPQPEEAAGMCGYKKTPATLGAKHQCRGTGNWAIERFCSSSPLNFELRFKIILLQLCQLA